MNKSIGVFLVVSLVLIIDLRVAHGFLSSPTKLSFSRSKRNKISYRSTLKEKKNDKKDFNQTDKNRDIFYVPEPRLLVCDLFAILVACEIVGLLDDLAMDGIQSFTEPITFDSFSNLPVLIKRDSLLSISWILSSLKNDGFSAEAIADEMSVIKSVFASFVDFCSLVIIYSLCSSFLTHQAVDGNNLLRQVSMCLMVLLPFRLILIRRY
jgi:hypothetical protein